jgi:hypothetical protein
VAPGTPRHVWRPGQHHESARARRRSARHSQIDHGHPSTLTGATRGPSSSHQNDQLAALGAKVSEVFHAGTPGAQFQPDGTTGRVSGPAPDQDSYGSFATFSDLASAMRTGRYARYMAAEQAGTELPT